MKDWDITFKNGGRAKKMRRRLITLILSIFLIMMMVGCTKSDGTSPYNSSCLVLLKNMPDEYSLLPESIKEEINISVALKNSSSGKTYKARLNDENGYSCELELVPGKYNARVSNNANNKLTMLEVEAEIDSFLLEKDHQAVVPVSITNLSEFVSALKNNEPKPEILEEHIYSRKVQLNGQILNLKDIKATGNFNLNINERLKPREIYRIPSKVYQGVSLLVQNQSDNFLLPDEATFVGVSFSSNNVVFPKGITLGMNLSEIANVEKGKMGTPTSIIGSPLVALGLGDATLVYLDGDTGDRISITIDPNKSYVRSITYEFAKYE